MTTPTRAQADLTLARDGGTPARTRPEAPMFPGGMELAQEELDALRRVIESKNLFRYYGVGAGPGEVASFEQRRATARGYLPCLGGAHRGGIARLVLVKQREGLHVREQVE